MAKRGKKPEEYGQLSLFEEREPEWLKPVDQLGYTISDPEGETFEAASGSIFDRQEHGQGQVSAPAEDADELMQFAEWLSRKNGT